MTVPTFPADAFLEAFKALLPPGRAWPRDPDLLPSIVARGLVPVVARQTDRSAALLVDAFPGTAVELLPEWESTLGFAGPALPAATTLAQRQAQVAWKVSDTGGQSVLHFQEVGAALGVTISVKSYAPWRCGQSKCGGTCGNADTFFVWTVHAQDQSLEAYFNVIKPAHTVVVFLTP